MSQFIITQGFLGPLDITQGYSSATTVSPIADFVGSPLSGTVPLLVQFTDLSLNAPTSWSWDFGDGMMSTSQNPLHAYGSAGTYTVILKATNAGGSDTKTRTSYITVTVPSAAGGGGGRSPPTSHGEVVAGRVYDYNAPNLEKILSLPPKAVRDKRKREIEVAVALMLASYLRK